MSDRIFCTDGERCERGCTVSRLCENKNPKLLRREGVLEKQIEQLQTDKVELVEKLGQSLDLIHIHPDNWEDEEELMYGEIKALINSVGEDEWILKSI